jgi:cystathionine gamma-synthase
MLGNDAYGGTYRLLTRIFGEWGVRVSCVDLGDPIAVEAGFTDTTRMLWVETPSNPLLNVVSITNLAVAAHAHDALLVVDNTFATPFLQRPLTLGADVVVHSTTKYVGGHSDVIGGFVATNSDELATKLKFHQYAIGAVPGPLDCYLLIRGLKTLGIRMERHCSNARAVAAFLLDHHAVDKVYYPGLAHHPGHDIATTQMSDFGGMVSFTLKSGVDVARKVCESTSIFTLAESLGGVESLIELPSVMTHASTVGSSLEPPDSLVRLSVGIEDIDDLLDDLAQALAL